MPFWIKRDERIRSGFKFLFKIAVQNIPVSSIRFDIIIKDVKSWIDQANENISTLQVSMKWYRD